MITDQNLFTIARKSDAVIYQQMVNGLSSNGVYYFQLSIICNFYVTWISNYFIYCENSLGTTLKSVFYILFLSMLMYKSAEKSVL